MHPRPDVCARVFLSIHITTELKEQVAKLIESMDKRSKKVAQQLQKIAKDNKEFEGEKSRMYAFVIVFNLLYSNNHLEAHQRIAFDRTCSVL